MCSIKHLRSKENHDIHIYTTKLLLTPGIAMLLVRLVKSNL